MTARRPLTRSQKRLKTVDGKDGISERLTTNLRQQSKSHTEVVGNGIGNYGVKNGSTTPNGVICNGPLRESSAPAIPNFDLCDVVILLAMIPTYALLRQYADVVVESRNSLDEKATMEHLSLYGHRNFFVPSNGLLLPILIHSVGAVTLAMLRNFSFVLSLFVPSLLYVVSRCVGCGKKSSCCVALLFCTDTASFALNQFFNLPLFALVFLLLTIGLLVRLHYIRNMSLVFYSYLIAAGLCLSITCCTDLYMVSFMLPLVVFHLYTTWTLLEDPRWTTMTIIWRLTLKSFWLILCPFFCHLLLVSVHFRLANRATSEAALFTSPFQLTLQGGLSSFTRAQALRVRVGSRVTLRSHFRRPPCWLSSHTDHYYPIQYSDGRASSFQQIVECNEQKSADNWWFVERSDRTMADNTVVVSGDSIRLRHGASGRYLQTHDVAAPQTAYLQEVSCFVQRSPSISPQIDWKIEVDASRWRPMSADSEGLMAIGDRFTLTHNDTNAVLCLTGKRWSDDDHQQSTDMLEVVAHQQPPYYHLWNVEEVKDAEFYNDDKSVAKANVFKQFIEFHEHLWLKLGRTANMEYPCSLLEWLLADFAYPLWEDRENKAFVLAVPNLILHYGSLLLAATVFPSLLLLAVVLCRRNVVCIPECDVQFLSISFVFLALPAAVYSIASVLFSDRVTHVGDYLPLQFCIFLLCGCVCEAFLRIFNRYSFKKLSLFFQLVIFLWLLYCVLNFLLLLPFISCKSLCQNRSDISGGLSIIGMEPVVSLQNWLIDRNYMR